MGLDMYVFRVQTPSLDPQKVYARDELQDYVVLPPQRAALVLYQQVLPYAQKLRVVNSYYDLEKISADHHMTDASIVGITPLEIWVAGQVAGVSATVTIRSEQIRAHYTIDREEECFVFKREKVAYWRKDYDLQELIYDVLAENIENTGYYLLTEEAVVAINGYGDQYCQWFEPTETSALFYWEWY